MQIGSSSAPDDWVQFPVAHLTKGKRETLLIGVMHYAPQKTWQTLAEDLANLSEGGYVLHAEGVKGTDVANNKRPLARMLRNLNLFMKDAHPKVVHQSSLVLPANTERHDMDFRTLDRLISPVHQLGIAGSSMLIAGLMKILSDEVRMITLYDFFASIGQKEQSAPAFLNGAILAGRNKFAIKARNNSKHQQVALLWGAAHIPGMIELMQADGWDLTLLTDRPFYEREPFKQAAAAARVELEARRARRSATA